MRALLQGAMNRATLMGANRSNAVAMGYCFDGAAVLEMARSRADLKGFGPSTGAEDAARPGLLNGQGRDPGHARDG